MPTEISEWETVTLQGGPRDGQTKRVLRKDRWFAVRKPSRMVAAPPLGRYVRSGPGVFSWVPEA